MTHGKPTVGRVTAVRPILYGRGGAGARGGVSGPFQNAVSDTPVPAWHESRPAETPGHRVLTYTIVWTNEDGGTSTDIERAYRGEVDERGTAVPATAFYQSPNHGTTPFAGRYEGAHPLLQTCTLNNNLCDVVDNPMRFALDTRGRLQDATVTAREEMVDRYPWVYAVMADEVRREVKVVPDPPADTNRPHRRPPRLRLPGGPQDHLTARPGRPGLGRRRARRPPQGRPHPLPLRPEPPRPVPATRRTGRDDRPPPRRHHRLRHRRNHGPAHGPGDRHRIDFDIHAVNRAFTLAPDDTPDRPLRITTRPVTLTAAVPEAVLNRR